MYDQQLTKVIGDSSPFVSRAPLSLSLEADVRETQSWAVVRAVKANFNKEQLW